MQPAGIPPNWEAALLQPPARVAIIGAGIAGLACARHLTAAGLSVTLFDKSRGVGGRMATRRLATPTGDAGFDHGAQYFTARSPDFAAEVAAWVAKGDAAPWPAAGPDAHVGTPAMNSPAKALAAGADVRLGQEITGLGSIDAKWRLEGADADPFDALVIAIPAEQAQRLLAPVEPGMAAIAAASMSEPCWTVMAAFAAPIVGVPDTLRGAGPIGWAARNSAKPGRTGPESWVIQADPAWSLAHLEAAPDAVTAALLSALGDATGASLPVPIVTSAHRWRFARSGNAGLRALWNKEMALGACGDWLAGPRVEAAWLSGHALAGMMTMG
jgi:predicted NAD/FAD-dependent oxidoreductase